MVELDYCTVDVECPDCDFTSTVTFRESRLQDVIICRGCKANIHLVDHMGTVAIATRNIERALDDITRTINITLRF